MKRFFLVLACVAVLLLSPTGARGQAADDGPWRGKLVVIYLKSNPDHGAVLQDPHVERAGSAGIYLVGKQAAPADSGDWREGVDLWIPMDNVGMVMVFNSMEEYQQRIDAARGKRGGSGGATTRPDRNLPSGGGL
jgi:hypothetical protein